MERLSNNFQSFLSVQKSKTKEKTSYAGYFFYNWLFFLGGRFSINLKSLLLQSERGCGSEHANPFSSRLLASRPAQLQRC